MPIFMAHISILVLQKDNLCCYPATEKKNVLTAILLSVNGIMSYLQASHAPIQGVITKMFPVLQASPPIKAAFRCIISLSTAPSSVKANITPPWDYCQNLLTGLYTALPSLILHFSGARVLMLICSELLNNFPVLYNRGQNLLHQHQGCCKTKYH